MDQWPMRCCLDSPARSLVRTDILKSQIRHIFNDLSLCCNSGRATVGLRLEGKLSDAPRCRAAGQ